MVRIKIKYIFLILAHLASGEGHSSCLKFLISQSKDPMALMKAINDQVLLQILFKILKTALISLIYHLYMLNQVK